MEDEAIHPRTLAITRFNNGFQLSTVKIIKGDVNVDKWNNEMIAAGILPKDFHDYDYETALFDPGGKAVKYAHYKTAEAAAAGHVSDQFLAEEQGVKVLEFKVGELWPAKVLGARNE